MTMEQCSLDVIRGADHKYVHLGTGDSFYFDLTDDPDQGDRKPMANLDDRRALLSNGIPPSDSNREVHSQMVYGVASVVHRTFRRALGRQIPWPFPPYNGVSQIRRAPVSRLIAQGRPPRPVGPR